MVFIYLNLIDNTEEKDLFEYIYIHFRKQMLHLANEILNNPYDSEDVVHNTFIDISKSIHIFENRNDKEICSYLMCATRGHAYNFIRKRNNENEKISELKYLLPAAYNPMEIICDYNTIVDAIRNLDELYSDVLYLYFVEQLTDKEISLLLGRKPSTIRTQIVRGKAMIISELNERGGI